MFSVSWNNKNMDGLRQTLHSAHILSTYNLLQPWKSNYTTYCRLKLDNRCKKNIWQWSNREEIRYCVSLIIKIFKHLACAFPHEMITYHKQTLIYILWKTQCFSCTPSLLENTRNAPMQFTRKSFTNANIYFIRWVLSYMYQLCLNLRIQLWNMSTQTVESIESKNLSKLGHLSRCIIKGKNINDELKWIVANSDTNRKSEKKTCIPIIVNTFVVASATFNGRQNDRCLDFSQLMDEWGKGYSTMIDWLLIKTSMFFFKSQIIKDKGK